VIDWIAIYAYETNTFLPVLLKQTGMIPEDERTQTIIVHDSYTIHDDGEEVETVSLNTTGWIDDRMELADAVGRRVDLDKLSPLVGGDIGQVTFNKHGSVESVDLYDEILENYGY